MSEKRAWSGIDRSHLAWMYFAVLVLGYLAVIARAPQPPLTVDYPDWVYQGVLFHGVLTGHPIAGYALKPYPVPNSLTTLALGLLDCVLPWVWAAKAWVSLYLVLAFAASVALSRASGATEWQMIVVLPTVAFLNLDFWWGHISFEIGLCLLLLLLTLLLRKQRTLPVAMLLGLIFFTHMEACACGMLLLGIWTWRDRQWRRLWALVPVATLTAWYAVGRFGSGNVDGGSVTPALYAWGTKKFVLYKAGTLLKTFGYVHVRSADGGSVTEAIFGRMIFLGLIAIGCGVAIVCLFLVAKSRGGQWRGPVRWLAAVLIGAAVLLPQVVLGVADPGSRLLLVGAVFAFFCARWSGRAGTTAAALSLLLSAANLLQFARVEADPRVTMTGAQLPAEVLAFGHVEPSVRLQMYEKLREGKMDETIFQTGMFRIRAR